MLIQKFYSYIRVLNANPDALSDLDDNTAKNITNSLQTVLESRQKTDELLEKAIQHFLSTYEGTPLIAQVQEMPQMRGMIPKTETVYPRQILNDVTIMTLQRLGR